MAEDKLTTIPKGLEGLITLDRPDGSDEGLLGNEGIGRDDVLIPRLGLAQKMSPEIDSTNAEKYIDGLKFMDLFHSLTKQVYGRGPLHFVILRRDDPRWIEFNPLEEGGGIRDRNVPAEDPRTQFGPNGEKPVATMFYDYIVLLLNGLDLSSPLENVIALSLKSSGVKAAKHLNFLINQRGKKMIYKGVYEVSTSHETDKKSNGVYAIYKFKNAGWLPAGSGVERLAGELFESWKDREANIDRGQSAEEIDDSMAANPEGAAAEM
jgi:hypothetical protein